MYHLNLLLVNHQGPLASIRHSIRHVWPTAVQLDLPVASSATWASSLARHVCIGETAYLTTRR
jgi:hypothetical protein